MDSTYVEKKKSSQLSESSEEYAVNSSLQQNAFEPAEKEMTKEEKKAQIDVASIRIPQKGFLSMEEERWEYVTGQAKVSKNIVMETKKENKQQLQNKKLDEMLSVLEKKEGANGILSLDVVLNFLVPLPQIDLSSDKAIVKNYEKIGEISDMLSKMAVFEDLLFTPEAIDAFYAKSYLALKNMVSYAKLRIDLMQDDLYQTATNSELLALSMIKPQDWNDAVEKVGDEKIEDLKALRDKLFACTTAERLLKFSLDQLEKEKTGNKNEINVEKVFTLSTIVADCADDTAEIDEIKQYILLQKHFPEEVKSLLKKEQEKDEDTALFPQMEPGEVFADNSLLSDNNVQETEPVPMEADLDKLIDAVKEEQAKNWEPKEIKEEEKTIKIDDLHVYYGSEKILYLGTNNEYLYAYLPSIYKKAGFDSWPLNEQYIKEQEEQRRKEEEEERLRQEQAQREHEEYLRQQAEWEAMENRIKARKERLAGMPRTNVLPSKEEVLNRSKLPENFGDLLDTFDLTEGEQKQNLDETVVDWERFQEPDEETLERYNRMERLKGAQLDGFEQEVYESEVQQEEQEDQKEESFEEEDQKEERVEKSQISNQNNDFEINEEDDFFTRRQKELNALRRKEKEKEKKRKRKRCSWMMITVFWAMVM